MRIRYLTEEPVVESHATFANTSCSKSRDNGKQIMHHIMQSVTRQSMQSVTRHSRTHHAVSPVTMANKSCTLSCNQSHDNPCNQSRDIREHIMQSGTRHSCMWVSSHAIILSSFLILTTSHSREIQTNNHNYYIIYNC